jgi:hypothetical protein
MFVRHSGGYAQQVAQQRFILLAGVIEGIHVFARYHQNVGWSLGVYVADDYAAIVLIDHISRRSSGKYFAKEAIRLTHGRMISQTRGRN